MIIGIDGNEANVINRVGSNIYAYEILKNLKTQNSNLKSQNQNLKFIIYLKEKPLLDLPKECDWWRYKILKPKILWTQWRLPLELYLTREKLSLFFTPGHYAPRFSPIPLVISIMDLAFLRFPDQFKKNDLYQLVNWTKYSVRKAKHILTISEFTKREIIHFYSCPENKITVTYPGMSNVKCQMSKPNVKSQIFNKYKINKNNYFIFIGTLQPRKNLINLIEAFLLLITHQSSLKLVIAGKKGWMYDEIFNKVKKLNLEHKVIFTGFISESEKQVLLANALALVLPSLYEGFGIPALEAMRAGCPVIITRNSSLVEVVGDAGIYIEDPYSIESISLALNKMIKLSSQARLKLIKLGLEQSKKFSWPKAAKDTLNVLTKLVPSGIGG
jgi:glycosyltransferase involved in cell wall biosynthesis